MDNPEPFYLSVRFWTAVLSPFVAVGATYVVQHLTFLQISQAEATAFFASLIVLAVTYILARTVRNTKLKL